MKIKLVVTPQWNKPPLSLSQKWRRGSNNAVNIIIEREGKHIFCLLKILSQVVPHRLQWVRCISSSGHGFDPRSAQFSCFILSEFSSTIRQMSGNRRPHPSPDITCHNHYKLFHTDANDLRCLRALKLIHTNQPPSWRTTPYRLSATAQLIPRHIRCFSPYLEAVSPTCNLPRMKCQRYLGLRETKLQESGESYVMLSYMHCTLQLT